MAQQLVEHPSSSARSWAQKPPGFYSEQALLGIAEIAFIAPRGSFLHVFILHARRSRRAMVVSKLHVVMLSITYACFD